MVEKSGDHQLIGSRYPIIWRVLDMLGGDPRISEPSTVVLVVSYFWNVHDSYLCVKDWTRPCNKFGMI